MKRGVENFLDTNILVYAFTDDARAARAQQLMAEPFTISVQALNEFANVGRKRLGLTWSQIEEAMESLIAASAEIVSMDEKITRSALELAARHTLSFYDATMLAAALKADCQRYYSEDLHAGLVVKESLTVINPFG